MSFWQPSAGDQLPFLSGNWFQPNNPGWALTHYELTGPDGGGNWHLARSDQINTSNPYLSGCYYNPSNGNLSSNSSWNSGNPVCLTKSNNFVSNLTVTIYPGDVVYAWDASGTLLASFNIPGSTGGTGPSVSSITVANQNSSTRNFTVTHTGTLSASDICYTINGTDVTTLPSPNTGITNLQTTPTGSTFDSYTPSLPYGSHSINIGETFLNFFNANSTSLNDVYSSNNGITVTFPDINSGVYENNLGTVDSGVNTTVTYGADIVRIYIESANSKQITRIAIYQNWAAYVANTGSFKVLYQFWDYENLTNNSPSYTSGVFYPDPDALYETTGSPNQTLTFPTGIQVGTFEWNFATAPTTQNNPPSTSSEYNRGSNYDDRFPLITTNLFNRQRSVYAIGMTHKDTWDLFL